MKLLNMVKMVDWKEMIKNFSIELFILFLFMVVIGTMWEILIRVSGIPLEQNTQTFIVTVMTILLYFLMKSKWDLEQRLANIEYNINELVEILELEESEFSDLSLNELKELIEEVEIEIEKRKGNDD